MKQKELRLNFSGNTKKERKVLEGTWTGIVKDPPTFITVDLYKPKKHGGYILVPTRVYLTANIWYGSQGNSKNEKKVRAIAKDTGMWTLHQVVKSVPYIDINRRIKITVTYNYKLGQYDINNKGFFWEKLFSDYLAPRTARGDDRKLRDDNVNYVYDVEYKHVISKEHFIEFKIEYEDNVYTKET